MPQIPTLYVELLRNIAVLVSLAVLYDFLGLFSRRESPGRRILGGILFGLAAVLTMMTPITFAAGVVFDGRTIAILAAGLFAGFSGAVSAMIVARGYRVYLGGVGSVAGISAIVLAGVAGALLYHLRRRDDRWVTVPALLSAGLAVQLGVVLLQWVLLPDAVALNLVTSVGPVEVIVYPVIFYLVARLYLDRERKIRVEREKQATDELYRNLFENTHAVMLLIRPKDGRIVDASPAAAEFYGWSREELCHKRISEINLMSEAEVKQEIAGALDAGESRFEFRHRLADGSVRDVAVTSGEVTLQGEPLLHSIITDITHEKRAEEQVERALKEKEALLMEIHHRVKNNLSVISSLINLQVEESSTREDALGALHKTRDRINAIAQVHNTRYREGDLARVYLPEYLNRLVDNLSSLYGERGVHLSLDCEEVEMEIITAVPVALIISELVTNAYKHAFPEGGAGEVRITVGRGNEELSIRVADNGVGLPENGEPPGASLGTELVGLLAEQINGRVSTRSDGGTAVEVTFPLSS
jgi:PAS domain S-box-containing protein